MQLESKQEKLIELSEKALHIEEEIVQLEKNYREALCNGSPVSHLMIIREKIKGLCRKEKLFNGAMDVRLRKL